MTPAKSHPCSELIDYRARCLYGALNDEIRNLLLKYDASTAVDLLQPFAAHLTALRRNTLPLSTSDITLKAQDATYETHRFLLGARSIYFHDHFLKDERWRKKAQIVLPSSDKFAELMLRFIYVDNLDADLSSDELRNVLEMSERLKIPALAEYFLDSELSKRERQQVQSRQAQEDLERYVLGEVIGKAWVIDQPYTQCLDSARTKWSEDSTTVADALLVVPIDDSSSKVYAVHKSMLIKSEYYLTAFTAGFAESSAELPVFTLDVIPEVAEIILTFLYVDRVDIPRELALDVLDAASFLLLSKDRSLKSLAAISVTSNDQELPPNTDVYSIVRIAWQTETQRLEQYAAKYIARNLDEYLYKDEFRDLIEESASRIESRQVTDTIELVDDIRFYLSQAYGIYLEMNPIDERKPGESVKEDMWVPLTTYEIQYNQQLEKLDNLLESLSLEA